MNGNKSNSVSFYENNYKLFVVEEPGIEGTDVFQLYSKFYYDYLQFYYKCL